MSDLPDSVELDKLILTFRFNWCTSVRYHVPSQNSFR